MAYYYIDNLELVFLWFLFGKMNGTFEMDVNKWQITLTMMPLSGYLLASVGTMFWIEKINIIYDIDIIL